MLCSTMGTECRNLSAYVLGPKPFLCSEWVDLD